MYNTEKTRILCLLTGSFLALCMPGYNFSFIAWIGLIPFLFFIITSPSLKEVIKNSYFFGVGYNLMCVKWMLSLHPLDWAGINGIFSIFIASLLWLLLACYLSIFMSLFGVWVSYFYKKSKNMFINSFLIAIGWSFIFNILISFGQMPFPWALLEYSQYLNIPILQYAQYIGGIGIGFLIVFINCLFFNIIYSFLKNKTTYKQSLTTSFVLLLFIFFFHIWGSNFLLKSNSSQKSVNVTLVQPNITVGCSLKSSTETTNFQNDIYQKIKKAPSGIIILPEACFLNILEKKDKEFCDKLNLMAKNNEKTIIIGAFSQSKTLDGSFQNSALVLDKKINNYEDFIYSKRNLVPFGEYMPYLNYLPTFLREKIESITRKREKGFENSTITTSMGKITPTICFEIIFPTAIKKQIHKDTDIIVNIGNLSWFHDSIIKEQFIAFNVMRAVELRKPLVASVNTGYSFIIDSFGKIILLTTKNTNSVATKKIYYTNEKSLFSQVYFH